MEAGNRRNAWTGAVLALGLALSGCTSSAGEPQATGAAAGMTGSGAVGLGGTGAVSGTSGGGGGGGTGDVGGVGGSAACPEARPLAQPNGAIVTLVFSPQLNGKPLVVGEPIEIPGGELTPSNVRLYVSEVELLRADGAAVPVDLVTSARAAAPYGVQLLDLESSETSTARVLAPEGTYSGARFTFGINDACNSGGMNQSPPLSASSQMVWPHVAGFLFFRYEALWTPTDATVVAPPSVIHMGGLVGRIFAPRAEAQGTLTVNASGGTSAVVRVSFDEIFRAASSMEPVEGLVFPSSEAIAGEHLRRAVPTAPIFTLQAP